VVGRRTSDRKIASSTPGRWIAGLLAGVKAGRVHLCRVAGNTSEIISIASGIRRLRLLKLVSVLSSANMLHGGEPLFTRPDSVHSDFGAS